MRIITIVGARPQFIKAQAVSRALFSTDKVEEILVHTGQHYDDNMSDIFFDELELLRPHYNLGVSGGGHGYQTGQMLEGIEKILKEQMPDMVLLYGDTNSTLAGAIAASKMNIKIAHVEAGLRSYDRSLPEEINRVVTDNLADLNFAPTQSAVDNLKIEGIEENVHFVGDVMFDASIHFLKKALDTSSILSQLDLEPKSYVLSTIHRASNTDNLSNLKILLEALSEVAKTIKVVIPLHPRTKTVLVQNELLNSYPSLHLIEPTGYLDMIKLQNNAKLIATDSGGIQKEALFFRVPCVIFRESTEWVELLNLKWSLLCPPNLGTDHIKELILSNLNLEGDEGSPYGDGNASKHIAEILTF